MRLLFASGVGWCWGEVWLHMSAHSLSSHQFPETASTEIFNTSWASSSPISWQILQMVYLITLSSSVTGMGNTKVQPFYFPSPGSSHALEKSEPSKLLIFVNSKCWGAEFRNRRGRHGKTKTLCLRSAVWELSFAYILHTCQPSEDATLRHLWMEQAEEDKYCFLVWLSYRNSDASLQALSGGKRKKLEIRKDPLCLTTPTSGTTLAHV